MASKLLYTAFSNLKKHSSFTLVSSKCWERQGWKLYPPCTPFVSDTCPSGDFITQTQNHVCVFPQPSCSVDAKFLQGTSGCQNSLLPKYVWLCPPAAPRKPFRTLDPGIMSKSIELTDHRQTPQCVLHASVILINNSVNSSKSSCSCLMCPHQVRACHCAYASLGLPQAQKSQTHYSPVKIPDVLLETNNSKTSSQFYSLSIPRLMKLSLHYQPAKLRGCSESS